MNQSGRQPSYGGYNNDQNDGSNYQPSYNQNSQHYGGQQPSYQRQQPQYNNEDNYGSFQPKQRQSNNSQGGGFQPDNKGTSSQVTSDFGGNDQAKRGYPSNRSGQYYNDQPVNLNLNDQYKREAPRSDYMNDENPSYDRGRPQPLAPQQRNNYMNPSNNPQNQSIGSQQQRGAPQAPPRMSAAARTAQPVSGAQVALQKSYDRGSEQQIPQYQNQKSNYDQQSQNQYNQMPISLSLSREENDQLVDAYKSDNFGDDSGNEVNDISEGNQEDQQRKRKLMAQDVGPHNPDYENTDTKPQQQFGFNSKPKMAMQQQQEPVTYNPTQQKKSNDQAQMYQDLYHKVMKSKDSRGNHHRISSQKVNTFDTYKESWNTLQDRNDKSYQKSLRQVNLQTQKRLAEAQKHKEYKLQQNAIQFKKSETVKEMQECTFSPRVQVSQQAKKYNEKLKERTFNRAQDQFLAKKNQTIEEARQGQISRDNEMRKTEFMSKGSKRIMRDTSQNKSATLNKSKSQTSFLQRNYYGPQDKSQARRRKSQISEGKDDRSRTRDLSASNNYLRDMSGSKISFLNSSNSGFLGKNRGPNGERLFSPSINDKSRMMSPRDKQTTFYMLHQQAQNQQQRQQIKVYQADRTAYKTANQGVMENVNNSSDALLVKQFYTKFCDIIQEQIQQSNQIYLVDVLDQLNFISEESIMKQSLKVNALLKQQRKNLYIDTDSGQFSGESEDITKNLFKVCCAILNLRPKQRGTNPLSDVILRQYLDQIKDSIQDNRETLIIDQLQMLKQLVNRKAFSLTDKQIYIINRKFQNMSHNCKQHQFTTKKQQNQEKVYRETQPFFSPKINQISRDIDKSNLQKQSPQNFHSEKKSISRTDLMHGYAEKYQDHKNQLREAYKDQDANQHLRFEPNLNPKSIKMAQEAQKSFTDRTMDQYLSKHNRVDKDPNQIEFEKQEKECTFRPTISSTKPGKVHTVNPNKSPAAISRGNGYLDHKQQQQLHKKTKSSNNLDKREKVLQQFLDTSPSRQQKEAPSESLNIPIQNYQQKKQDEQPPVHRGLQQQIPSQIPQSQDRLLYNQADNKQQETQARQPPNQTARPMRTLNSMLPVVEEPICVLKIELDGQHIEEIKVFENDNPSEIVQKFGNNFNLSQGARQRLLEQIQEQIQMDEDEDAD